MYSSNYDDYFVISYDARTDKSWNAMLIEDQGLGIPTFNGNAKRSEMGIFGCPENAEQRRAGTMGQQEIDCSYGGNGWFRQNVNGTFTWRDRGPLGNKITRAIDASKLYLTYDGTYPRTAIDRNDGANCFPGLYSVGVQNVRYAHNFGVNMAYSDGHVESLTGPLIGRGTPVPVSNTFLNGHVWMLDHEVWQQ